MLKLNKLLAIVDDSKSSFRKLISDYKVFFEKKQSEFQGVKKTYAPREGTKDETSMRQLKLVVTTVDEKLQYLEENGKEYVQNVMDVEATNSSGVKVELKVDFGGKVTSFGKLSALELMKLKSILEKEGLESMYATIPVRSDSEIWEPTVNEMFAGRNIFQTPLQSGVNKSVEKEEYILLDPNLKNVADTSRYTATKSVRSTVVELGDYTLQHFSGETTHRFRAAVLARRSAMLTAISGAIKEANDTTVVASEFSAEKLFDYLHDKLKE